MCYNHFHQCLDDELSWCAFLFSLALGESTGLYAMATALLKGVQTYLDFGNLQPGCRNNDQKRAIGHIQLFPGFIYLEW